MSDADNECSSAEEILSEAEFRALVKKLWSSDATTNQMHPREKSFPKKFIIKKNPADRKEKANKLLSRDSLIFSRIPPRRMRLGHGTGRPWPKWHLLGTGREGRVRRRS